MTNRFNLLLLLAAFLGHFWLTTVGWENKNLPGMEFRQTQTGLSTYFIQQEDNYSLAYPTPVLGKPRESARGKHSKGALKRGHCLTLDKITMRT